MKATHSVYLYQATRTRPNASTVSSKFVYQIANISPVQVRENTASLISKPYLGRLPPFPRQRIADRVAPFRIRLHAFTGIESLDEWPNVKAWIERIETRPAVKAGLNPKTE
jgi:hypothetical protein